MSPTVNGGLDWAQNIANLWLDPAPARVHQDQFQPGLSGGLPFLG